MKNVFDVLTYDIDPRKESTCSSVFDLVEAVDKFVFVCLPTPMKNNGQCDTEIVRKSVKSIDKAAARLNKSVTAIIKSTIPPGTTREIDDQCSNVDVIFNPEFLTEANSFEDFRNQSRIIIGGKRPASTAVKTMYRKAFPKTPIIKTSSEHAEMVKHFINCFLSMKVSFSNEMYQICNNLDLDYDKIIEYALYDDRLGKTHFSVPGPDGCLGFGGHCLPKDLRSTKYEANKAGVTTVILDAIWHKNNQVRPESDRDWEKMIGRAVVKE